MAGAYTFAGRSIPQLVDATRSYLKRHRDGEIGALGGIEGVCDTLECCYQPLTVAVRVCCSCGLYLGTDLWTGDDAHEEMATVTHGICDACYVKSHGELPSDGAGEKSSA